MQNLQCWLSTVCVLLFIFKSCFFDAHPFQSGHSLGGQIPIWMEDGRMYPGYSGEFLLSLSHLYRGILWDSDPSVWWIVVYIEYIFFKYDFNGFP